MFKSLSASFLFAWQILIFIIWEKIYFKLGKKCKISQGETTEYRWHFGPQKITEVEFIYYYVVILVWLMCVLLGLTTQ